MKNSHDRHYEERELLARHCEPTGPRKARPDDKLREAIQNLSAGTVWIASSLSLLAMTATQRSDYKE
jgi:hypothetical protein